MKIFYIKEQHNSHNSNFNKVIKIYIKINENLEIKYKIYQVETTIIITIITKMIYL
jgi:hypothetical protein